MFSMALPVIGCAVPEAANMFIDVVLVVAASSFYFKLNTSTAKNLAVPHGAVRARHVDRSLERERDLGPTKSNPSLLFRKSNK